MDRWAIPSKALREIDESLSAATSGFSSTEQEALCADDIDGALNRAVSQLAGAFDAVLITDPLFDLFLHIVSKKPRCLADPVMLKSITDALVALWHRTTPEEIAVVGVRHLVRFLQETADLVDCYKVTSGSSNGSSSGSPFNSSENIPSPNHQHHHHHQSKQQQQHADADSSATTPLDQSGVSPPGTGVDTPYLLSGYTFTERFTLPIVAALLDILANFVIPAHRHSWFEHESTSAATSAVLRVMSLMSADMLDEDVVGDLGTVCQAIHSQNLPAVVQSRAGWRVAAALSSDLVRGIETRKYIAEHFEVLAVHPAGCNVVHALLDSGSGTPMPRSLCRRLLNDSKVSNIEHKGARLPAIVALAMDGVGCEVANNALHQTRGLFSLIFADVLRRYQPIIQSCGPHTAQVVHWAQAQPAMEDCLVFLDPTRCDEECIVPRRSVAYSEAVSRWSRALAKLRRFEEDDEQQRVRAAGSSSTGYAQPLESGSPSSSPSSPLSSSPGAASPGGGSLGLNANRRWLDKLQGLFQLPELCMDPHGTSCGARCTRVHLEHDADVAALRSSAGTRAGIFTRAAVSRISVPLTVMVPEAQQQQQNGSNSTAGIFHCNTTDAEPTAGLIAYLDKEWPVGIPITADQLCAQYATRRCANPRQCRQIHLPAEVFHRVVQALAQVQIQQQQQYNNNTNNGNQQQQQDGSGFSNVETTMTLKEGVPVAYGGNAAASGGYPAHCESGGQQQQQQYYQNHHHHHHHPDAPPPPPPPHQHAGGSNNGGDVANRSTHSFGSGSSNGNRHRLTRGGMSASRPERPRETHSPISNNQSNNNNNSNNQHASEMKSTGSSALAAAFLDHSPVNKTTTTPQKKDAVVTLQQQQQQPAVNNKMRKKQHNPYSHISASNNREDDRSSAGAESNGQPSTTASTGTHLSTIIARHVRAMQEGTPTPPASVISQQQQQQQQNQQQSNPFAHPGPYAPLLSHHQQHHFPHQHHHHHHQFAGAPYPVAPSLPKQHHHQQHHHHHQPQQFYQQQQHQQLSTSQLDSHNNTPVAAASSSRGGGGGGGIKILPVTCESLSNSHNNSAASYPVPPPPPPPPQAPGSWMDHSNNNNNNNLRTRSPTMETSGAASVSASGGGGGGKSLSAGAVRECKYFKLGCCDKGEKCRFRHNPESVRFKK